MARVNTGMCGCGTRVYCNLSVPRRNKAQEAHLEAYPDQVAVVILPAIGDSRIFIDENPNEKVYPSQ
jgi:hypothetical protein